VWGGGSKEVSGVKQPGGRAVCRHAVEHPPPPPPPPPARAPPSGLLSLIGFWIPGEGERGRRTAKCLIRLFTPGKRGSVDLAPLSFLGFFSSRRAVRPVYQRRVGFANLGSYSLAHTPRVSPFKVMFGPPVSPSPSGDVSYTPTPTLARPILGPGSVYMPSWPSQKGLCTDPGPGVCLARIGVDIQLLRSLYERTLAEYSLVCSGRPFMLPDRGSPRFCFALLS